MKLFFTARDNPSVVFVWSFVQPSSTAGTPVFDSYQMLSKAVARPDGIQQREVGIPTVWTAIETLDVIAFVGFETIIAVRTDSRLCAPPIRKVPSTKDKKR